MTQFTYFTSPRGGDPAEQSAAETRVPAWQSITAQSHPSARVLVLDPRRARPRQGVLDQRRMPVAARTEVGALVVHNRVPLLWGLAGPKPDALASDQAGAQFVTHCLGTEVRAILAVGVVHIGHHPGVRTGGQSVGHHFFDSLPAWRLVASSRLLPRPADASLDTLGYLCQYPRVSPPIVELDVQRAKRPQQRVLLLARRPRNADRHGQPSGGRDIHTSRGPRWISTRRQTCGNPLNIKPRHR